MRELPSLRALRAFEAVAKLSSVRKAAAALCVTPAAVSKQVRTLETYLGCALFVREHQRMALTDSGKTYFSKVGAALHEIQRATDEVARQEERHALRIRSYTTLSVYWLIPRLSEFYQLHPEVDIEITTTSRWVDFAVADADAAVRLGEGKWEGMDAYQLMPNILAPVCSPSVAAHLKAVSDLERCTLLHALARPDDWNYWLSVYGPGVTDPYRGQRYESSVLAYQAAAQGQGVAMAQLELIASELKHANLVLPFRGTLNRGGFTYYLVVPRDRAKIPGLEVLRRWLLEQH